MISLIINSRSLEVILFKSRKPWLGGLRLVGSMGGGELISVNRISGELLWSGLSSISGGGLGLGLGLLGAVLLGAWVLLLNSRGRGGKWGSVRFGLVLGWRGDWRESLMFS